MTPLRTKSILLTGHTGFKGKWLSALLGRSGARVSGLSMESEQGAGSSFTTNVPLEAEYSADIRNYEECHWTVSSVAPELVFHLAAQPLVRRSYRDPLETWSTNVMGTANILEACRQSPSVRAIVIITTDKCYENKEWVHPYRETDRLGGRDPYSASKACAELLTASYRESFLRGTQIRVATARAGNVIGGGDFAEDRLIPDAVRAFSKGKPLVLRNPHATRPWQHVLEPLSGYLALGDKLLAEPDGDFDRAWNFGPNADGNASVGQVAEQFARHWGDGKVECLKDHSEPHEATLLQLDNSLARVKLGWEPRWSLNEAIRHTADWYRAWHEKGDINTLMQRQIEDYFLSPSA